MFHSMYVTVANVYIIIIKERVHEKVEKRTNFTQKGLVETTVESTQSSGIDPSFGSGSAEP